MNSPTMLTSKIDVYFVENNYANIYSKYFNALVYFANEYVNNSMEAEGIAQEALITLWEKRSSIEDTKVRSFLYTIAKNKCLNILKHGKVAEKYVSYKQAVDRELNLMALESSTFEVIVADELQEKINEILQTLPEKCRIVFELSRFKSYKNKEIAQELKISIKTVEAQMSKALKILRSSLHPYSPMIYFFMVSGID